MRARLLAATVGLVAIAGSCSRRAVASRDAGFATFVDTVATAELRALNAPSVTIAVARGADMVVLKSYGIADEEHAVPATPETVYRIASVSKQFTAATVMRLVEQHRIALDDDVTKYLPQFHADGAIVTIRQLLNHTSGVQDFTSVPAVAGVERLDLTDGEVLAVFQDKPANFAPGTNFDYNNSGFYLLAMVIEHVTGQSYAAYLRDSVLVPLGLHSTEACSHTRIVPHRARGYVLVNKQLANEPYISFAGPKGGGDICSTASDLVTWTRALAGGKVISAASYAVMTTPSSLADGRKIAYGSGLFLSDLDGHPEVFHGGDFVGFNAFLAWYPADDVTVVVLGNAEALQLYNGNLGRRLARRLLAVPAPASTGVLIPAEDRSRYSGTFRAGATTIQVRADSERLIATSATVWQLAVVAADTIGATPAPVWGGAFYSKGNGVFVSVINPAAELHFTALAGRSVHSTRLSLTLNGRAFGDFIRD
jgi:CubicO group peptidase (beta-lactamase class C family)